jgi:hypothetical protein
VEDKIKPEGRHLAEKWLDTQKDASVIYAAFRTGVFFSPEQIRELAHGLEASEQPFVLVLQLSETNNIEAEYLPLGSQPLVSSSLMSWTRSPISVAVVRAMPVV